MCKAILIPEIARLCMQNQIRKQLFFLECWTFYEAHRLASIWLQIITNIILYNEGSSWSGGILKEDTYLRNGCDQLLGYTL